MTYMYVPFEWHVYVECPSALPESIFIYSAMDKHCCCLERRSKSKETLKSETSINKMV